MREGCSTRCQIVVLLEGIDAGAPRDDYLSDGRLILLDECNEDLSSVNRCHIRHEAVSLGLPRGLKLLEKN